MDHFIYKSEKDTIIDSLVLRKAGPYLLHQEGDKVWAWRSDTLYLLYDFGVSVGDVVVLTTLGWFNKYVPHEYSVDNIDTVNVNGQLLKRFWVNTTDNPAYEYAPWSFRYMEKVGAMGTMMEFIGNHLLVTTAVGEWLRCYSYSITNCKSPTFLFYGGTNCYWDVSTSAIPEGQITLSPNPAHDFLAINTTQEWPISELSLMDMTGRVLQTQQFGVAQQQVQVPLAGLPTGMYFVQVRSGERIGMYRVAKEAQ